MKYSMMLGLLLLPLLGLRDRTWTDPDDGSDIGGLSPVRNQVFYLRLHIGGGRLPDDPAALICIKPHGDLS
ncbi:MAG: hypothetical protein OHK0039_33260 [Bacteroidia bacterium]